MGHLLKAAAFICVFLYAAKGSAEWRVDIESETVPASQTEVTVAITLYTDLSVGMVAIPLVARELDPGSFWTGSLPVDCDPYPVQGVIWNWQNPDFPMDLQEFCPGPGCDDPFNAYDGVSPDNFFIRASGGLEPPAPSGHEIVYFSLDVTTSLGRFEFDTACFTGALNKIFLIGSDYIDHGPPQPGFTFNKGVITITDCDCSMLGDLNLDGAINPVDMVLMVNQVYLSGSLPEEIPTCLTPNGDWNFDGNVNPIDVVFMVRYVYLGSPTLPCDPCLGEKLPDLMIGEDDFYFQTNPVAVDEPVWLWVNVNNIGWATAYAPTLDIYAGDPNAGGTLLGTGTLEDIPLSGSSGYYGGQFTFTSPGTIEIYGIADYGDLIVEINENNNQNHQTLEVIESGIARPVLGTAMPRIPVELRLR